MDNKPFIRDIALALDKTGSVMNGQQVANELNKYNRTTTYGDSYSGDRGTYTLIHATYDWLKGLGMIKEADIVARVFLNQNGDHAWDK